MRRHDAIAPVCYAAALDRSQDIPRMKPSRDIHTLIQIMARLRTPESGCPWDIEQTFASIAPYTIEEAYEVADAISRGDLDRGLPDELGDLLLAGRLSRSNG
jgi:uncharacterized protein YabN with tetrapyrrole methylase and pyrophosphatase domain